jgi:hypothetical protein
MENAPPGVWPRMTVAEVAFVKQHSSRSCGVQYEVGMMENENPWNGVGCQGMAKGEWTGSFGRKGKNEGKILGPLHF